MKYYIMLALALFSMSVQSATPQQVTEIVKTMFISSVKTDGTLQYEVCMVPPPEVKDGRAVCSTFSWEAFEKTSRVCKVIIASEIPFMTCPDPA